MNIELAPVRLNSLSHGVNRELWFWIVYTLIKYRGMFDIEDEEENKKTEKKGKAAKAGNEKKAESLCC